MGGTVCRLQNYATLASVARRARSLGREQSCFVQNGDRFWPVGFKSVPHVGFAESRSQCHVGSTVHVTMSCQICGVFCGTSAECPFGYAHVLTEIPEN